MALDVEPEAEYREQAARLVARAREFGRTYLMLSDGTLVLREDHERWVQRNREIARLVEEHEFQRQMEMLHPKPWWVIILFVFGLIAGIGFLFFY